MTMTY
ncbi:hypothetical protein FG05_35087 [Fusarium graminearum]